MDTPKILQKTSAYWGDQMLEALGLCVLHFRDEEYAKRSTVISILEALQFKTHGS